LTTTITRQQVSPLTAARETVLELGNQILQVLGAEEEVEDLETFASDSLYLQLFEVIFPQFNLSEVEQGNTPEEMAENIQELLNVLG
jgi:hypothetical protein